MRKVMINREIILLTLVYAVLLQPELFSLNGLVNKIFLLLKCAVCLFAFLIYFREDRLTRPMILIIFFQATLALATLLKATEITYVIKTSIFLIGFCMVTELAMRRDKAVAVKAFYYTTGLYVFINFLCMLLFPAGLWVRNEEPHWFLGQKNLMILMIVPALAAGMLLLSEKGKKCSFTYAVLFVASLYSIARSGSATSLVVMLLFCLFYGLYLIKLNLKQIFNSFVFAVAVVLANVFVFSANNVPIVKWLVVEVLHKSLHFSGRVTIWDHAMKWIRQSLILGWGYEKTNVIVEKLGGNPNFLSCHNYFLNILYHQGLLGLTLILLFWGGFCLKLYNCRRKLCAQIVAVAVLALLVDGIFESLGLCEPLYWLAMVGMCYKWKKSDGKEEGNSGHYRTFGRAV